MNIPEKIKKYCKIVDKEPTYIKFYEVKEFIDKVSKISIKKQIENIKEKGNPII